MEYRYINPEYLEKVSAGDPEIIRELVNIFREQSAEAYKEMNVLLKAGDYVNLGMLAHKVKSSVAIMGMNSLAEMLKTFELQAKEGRESRSYSSYIERFGNETTHAISELDELFKNISGK